MDKKGETIEDWMIEKQLILINKFDDAPSLSWRTTSSPDSAMATDNVHQMITTREFASN